jgi:hypothetical protein
MSRPPVLAPEEALEIHEKYWGQNWSMSQIARLYRVSEGTVLKAVHRRHPYDRIEIFYETGG